MASKRDRLAKSFVNRMQGSARQGQKYTTVTKGGQTYHKYGPGRLFKAGTPQRSVAPARSPASKAALEARIEARQGRQVSLMQRDRQRAKGKGAVTAADVKPLPQAAAPSVPGSAGLRWGTPSWAAPGAKTAPPLTDPAARERLRAAATGKGRQLNVAQSSPRYGQRFKITQRGGTRYHTYAPGRSFADVQRGAGTAQYKKRTPRKPSTQTAWGRPLHWSS